MGNELNLVKFSRLYQMAYKKKTGYLRSFVTIISMQHIYVSDNCARLNI